MNHSFDVDLAVQFGIEEAIIIENLAFWIKKNVANNQNFIDGKYWTFNSARAFNELFPYMNPSKINRVLKKLEKDGIIEIGNHNKAAYDKTSWYTIINQEILDKYKINIDVSSFCKMKNGFDKTENGFCNLQDRFSQNEKPIPDINTDINTYKKNTCNSDESLGLNPKGFPRKDRIEKFLNENMDGIDYTKEIQEVIAKHLKKESEEKVLATLLETYKVGLETGRSLSEIATIIAKGNALRPKNKIEKKNTGVEIDATSTKIEKDIVIPSPTPAKKRETLGESDLPKDEIDEVYSNDELVKLFGKFSRYCREIKFNPNTTPDEKTRIKKLQQDFNKITCVKTAKEFINKNNLKIS